eukprot:TRINITY_DN6181_c0_g1_i1.p1 TRINITY_DN6181_c0_g1~~TRINITY_DN6181_c0_g1_i1.p1  ORF type:complete len:527 (+),score=133.05 TRINITY_DN6181_c0_g1_i1:135-1715(+)
MPKVAAFTQYLLENKHIRQALNHCSPDDADELGTALFFLFQSKQQSGVLIADSVKDLRIEGSISLTLRTVSVPLSVLSQIARFHCKKYIRKYLGPQLKKIISSKRPFELDPHKMKTGDSAEENAKNMMQMTRAVVGELWNSVHHTPKIVKDLLVALNDRLNPANKIETAIRVVANFYILRVIGPAIVCPTKDVVGTSSVADRNSRKLLLIGKILQKICNQMTSFEEDYLRPLTPILGLETPQFVQFVTTLLNSPLRGDGASSAGITKRLVDASALRLLEWYQKNGAQVEKDIEAQSGQLGVVQYRKKMDSFRPDAESVNQPEDWQEVWKRVQQSLNLSNVITTTSFLQRSSVGPSTRLSPSLSDCDISPTDKHSVASFPQFRSGASFGSLIRSNSVSSAGVSTQDYNNYSAALDNATTDFSDTSSFADIADIPEDKPMLLKCFDVTRERLCITYIEDFSFSSLVSWIQAKFPEISENSFRLEYESEGDDGSRDVAAVNDEDTFGDFLTNGVISDHPNYTLYRLNIR